MDLDTVTINSEDQTLDNIMKLIERAIDYFPGDVWDSVIFKGDLKIPNDSKLLLNGKTHKSHLMSKLIYRLRRLKEKNPLLGITEYSVYFLRSKIKEGKVELVIVHDFMDENVGIVSLFYSLQNASSKLIAHALGHNRNLEHHEEPVDIMYRNLIYNPNSINDFCPRCVYDLKRGTNI